MKVAFDTSVLVASVLEEHPHHARARPWARAATSGELEARISWHAAAETWSVLTRLPEPLRVAPSIANLVIDRLLESFRPIRIAGAIYRAAMQRCAEKDLRSGALFDALHLICAESEGLAALVTFDRLDFERLCNTESPSILVPPDPPELIFP